MSRVFLQLEARTLTKFQGFLLLMAVCCCCARAQIAFSVSALQSQLGDNSSAYISHDVALSNLVGQAGGPQRWDFSQAPAPGESIHRIDIVATDDGGHGASFSSAAYAERETGDTDGTEAWRYYSIGPGLGRTYYGFYQPVDLGLPVDPEIDFAVPTIDLPDSIQYGQSWKRSVDWVQFVAGLPLATHFTAEAVVDAYGTLVLPGIGEVPALRVNQLDSYDVNLSGNPFGSQFNTNYYWLVQGIGIAAQVIFHVDELAVSGGSPHTNTVARVFEVRPWRAADLRIQRQSDAAVLNWRQETNTSGYRVEFIENLNSTNWQWLAEPAGDTWSYSFSATQAQRYFRVSVKP